MPLYLFNVKKENKYHQIEKEYIFLYSYTLFSQRDWYFSKKYLEKALLSDVYHEANFRYQMNPQCYTEIAQQIRRFVTDMILITKR